MKTISAGLDRASACARDLEDRLGHVGGPDEGGVGRVEDDDRAVLVRPVHELLQLVL